MNGDGTVDFDGVRDWVVGATSDHHAPAERSHVRLFSGVDASEIRAHSIAGAGKRFGQSLEDQSILGTFFGVRRGDRGGFALAELPDLGGDGIAEDSEDPGDEVASSSRVPG